ncbi:hypothetical protein H0E87_015867 [Populus deltoides]|uniref:Peptidase A1 domain-containing protein n=1 Tax=Populus deltoides TaxID=3696 RepID=A0A8T2Y6P9_POPDE|nr:hypothetical protein H0E87_015867 [Populus deltoides]
MFNQQEKVTTSSELTVELHSRTSLQKTTHTDYKSLTLSRLQRDSARVKSLLTRLDLAINYFSTSDLKPLETDSEFKSEALQSPVISGTSQGSTSGDWSIDVSECRNDTCLYEFRTGMGLVPLVILLLGLSLSARLQLIMWVSAVIGCGHNNEGLFIGAAGLLGLGGGSLSFPSQIITTSFSHCLVDRDSESASTLEFNSTLPPNTVTAALIRNHQLDTFYYVGLTGLSVGGELVSIPESAFQIDESGNGGNPSSRGNVEVPTVSFHFPDGKLLPLQAKNYMVPLDSEGTFCFAFAPTASSLSIIGNVQQRGTRVVYDLVDPFVRF